MSKTPPARGTRATATTALLVAGFLVACGLVGAPPVAATTVAEATVDPSPPAVGSPTPTDPASATTPAPTDDASSSPSPIETPSPTEPPAEESAQPAPETAPPDAARTAPAVPALVDPTRPVLPVSPIAPATPTLPRLSGSLYDSAISASRATYPVGARTVLVAPVATFWDATTAAGIAGALQAPVLLVGVNAVPDAVAAELRRLAPTTIAVIGSSRVVADTVLTQLRGLTADVRRLDGGSDYGTSRLALASLPTDVSTVYIASSNSARGGASLLDIPIAASTASGAGGGVLLVDGLAAAADADTIAAIHRVGATNVVLVGDTTTLVGSYEQSLVAAGFVVRRSGATDESERAMQAAGLRTTGAQRVVLSHRAVQSDIAVAAVVAGGSRQPFAFGYYACVPDGTAAYLVAQGARVIAVGDTSWLAPPVESGSSCSAEKPRRDAMLTNALVSIARQYGGGGYYISAIELDGAKEEFSLSGGTRNDPASMMKLFAAWAGLAHIDAGLASPTTLLPGGLYLRDCITVMIQASDNDCHTDIVRWIGGQGINRMIADAGFHNTSYGNVNISSSILYAGNRTTTDDVAQFLQRLRAGQMLSPASTTFLLDLMGDQIWRSRLASGIPWGVPQQSKPGSIWLASGLTQADSGIVYGSRSRVAISILVTGSVDRAALRAITRTIYSHYNGGFGAAASYPTEQMISVAPVALRTAPAGPAVGTLPPGYFIEVLDASRMWYQIRWAGRELWVDWRALRTR